MVNEQMPQGNFNNSEDILNSDQYKLARNQLSEIAKRGTIEQYEFYKVIEDKFGGKIPHELLQNVKINIENDIFLWNKNEDDVWYGLNLDSVINSQGYFQLENSEFFNIPGPITQQRLLKLVKDYLPGDSSDYFYIQIINQLVVDGIIRPLIDDQGQIFYESVSGNPAPQSGTFEYNTYSGDGSNQSAAEQQPNTGSSSNSGGNLDVIELNNPIPQPETTTPQQTENTMQQEQQHTPDGQTEVGPNRSLSRDWKTDPPQDFEELMELYTTLKNLPGSQENLESVKEDLKKIDISKAFFGVHRLDYFVQNNGEGAIKFSKDIKNGLGDGNDAPVVFKIDSFPKMMDAVDQSNREFKAFFKELVPNLKGIIASCKSLNNLKSADQNLRNKLQVDQRLPFLSIEKDVYAIADQATFQTKQDDVLTRLKDFVTKIKIDKDYYEQSVREPDTLLLLQDIEQVQKYYYIYGLDANNPDINEKHQRISDLSEYFYVRYDLRKPGFEDVSDSMLEIVTDTYKTELIKVLTTQNYHEVALSEDVNFVYDIMSELSAFYSAKPLSNGRYLEELIKTVPELKDLAQNVSDPDQYIDFYILRGTFDNFNSALLELQGHVVEQKFEAVKQQFVADQNNLLDRIKEFDQLVDQFTVSDERKAELKQKSDEIESKINDFYTNPFQENYVSRVEKLNDAIAKHKEVLVNDYYQDSYQAALDMFGKSYVTTGLKGFEKQARESIELEDAEEVDIENTLQHRLQYTQARADFLAQMPETKGSEYIQSFISMVKKGLETVGDAALKAQLIAVLRRPFTESEIFKTKFTLDISPLTLPEEERAEFVWILNERDENGETLRERMESQIEAFNLYDDAVEDLESQLGFLRSRLEMYKGFGDYCQKTKMKVRQKLNNYTVEGKRITPEYHDQDYKFDIGDSRNQLGDLSVDFFTQGIPQNKNLREQHLDSLRQITLLLQNSAIDLELNIKEIAGDKELKQLELRLTDQKDICYQLLAENDEALDDPEYLSRRNEYKLSLGQLKERSEYKYDMHICAEAQLYKDYMDKPAFVSSAYGIELKEIIKKLHFPSYLDVLVYEKLRLLPTLSDDSQKRSVLSEVYKIIQDQGNEFPKTAKGLQLLNELYNAILDLASSSDQINQLNDQIQKNTHELNRLKAESEVVHEDTKIYEKVAGLQKQNAEIQDLYKDYRDNAENRYQLRKGKADESDITENRLIIIRIKDSLIDKLESYDGFVKKRLHIGMTNDEFNNIEKQLRPLMNFFIQQKAKIEAELQDYSSNQRGKKTKESKRLREEELKIQLAENAEIYNKFAEIWMQGRLSRYFTLESELTDKIIEEKIKLHKERGGKSLESLLTLKERLETEVEVKGRKQTKVALRVKIAALLGATPAPALIGATLGSTFGPMGTLAGGAFGASITAAAESFNAYLRDEGLSLEDLSEDFTNKKNTEKGGIPDYFAAAYGNVISKLGYDVDTFIETLKMQKSSEVLYDLNKHPVMKRIHEINALRRYNIIPNNHPLALGAMTLQRQVIDAVSQLEIKSGMAFEYSVGDTAEYQANSTEAQKIAREEAKKVKETTDALIKMQLEKNKSDLETRLNKLGAGRSKTRRMFKAIMSGATSFGISMGAVGLGAGSNWAIPTIAGGYGATKVARKFDSVWDWFADFFRPKK